LSNDVSAVDVSTDALCVMSLCMKTHSSQFVYHVPDVCHFSGSWKF